MHLIYKIDDEIDLNYQKVAYQQDQVQMQQQMNKVGVQELTQGQCICEYPSRVSSPIMVDEECHWVAENGDVLKYSCGGEVSVVFTLLGQPSSLASLDCVSFLVADFAHQSIFSREEGEVDALHNLICEYNDSAFAGPNCIKIAPVSKNMFFTDSGPFMETALDYPRGSFFLYRFDTQKLKCLAYKNLAYPAGLQIDEQEKYALVCEMGNNRILKFVLDETLAANYSVFHQFQGRFGPSSIFLHDGLYYISLFEFAPLASSGMLAVLNPNAELMFKLIIPTGPQILGICIYQFIEPVNEEVIFVAQSNKIYRIKLEKNQSQDKPNQPIHKNI